MTKSFTKDDLADNGVVVALGEVHTGLLHHSCAVSAGTAARLLDIVLGERVRRSDRPIPYAVSPPRLTGVDCLLPTSTGAKVRGVGTVVSRASITGGHLVQGSAYLQVVRGRQSRRLPWSHYLARPGIVETLGKVDGKQLADGFLAIWSAHEQLDLGAVSRRAMDAVQDSGELDRRTAFKFARTKLRWVIAGDGTQARSVVFGIHNDVARTVRMGGHGLEAATVAEFCEDLARHDWLLTTLSSLVERSRIGAGPRSAVLERLKPAVDFLLHLWMPKARTDQALHDLWQGLEHHLGLTGQWQANVDRVRDQLALATTEMLSTRS